MHWTGVWSLEVAALRTRFSCDKDTPDRAGVHEQSTHHTHLLHFSVILMLVCYLGHIPYEFM